MRPVRATQLRLVFGLVFLGGAIGWSAAAVLEGNGGILPRVPWSAAGGLAFFAAILFGGAWYMYDRLQRKKRSVELLLAFRLLVLAKASALVGAIVGGGYAGFVVYVLPEYDTGDGRDRVIRGLGAAVAGLLLAVGGLLLERACKVPKGPEGADADDTEQPESRT